MREKEHFIHVDSKINISYLFISSSSKKNLIEKYLRMRHYELFVGKENDRFDVFIQLLFLNMNIQLIFVFAKFGDIYITHAAMMMTKRIMIQLMSNRVKMISFSSYICLKLCVSEVD